MELYFGVGKAIVWVQDVNFESEVGTEVYVGNSSLGSGISRTTKAACHDDKDFEAITASGAKK